MRILGIDPAIASVGYGLIEIVGKTAHLHEFGVIKTSSKESIGSRLRTIYIDLHKIIKDLRPNAIAVEKLFFYRMSNLIEVAEARGVILLVLSECGIEPQEYSPPEVKQCLTGHGKADKKAVQLGVQRELGLDKIPQPDDAADALAIALTYYFRQLDRVVA